MAKHCLVVNFINILRAQFLYKKLAPKIKSQKISRKKLLKDFRTKKAARKMLMKITQGDDKWKPKSNKLIVSDFMAHWPCMFQSKF